MEVCCCFSKTARFAKLKENDLCIMVGAWETYSTTDMTTLVEMSPQEATAFIDRTEQQQKIQLAIGCWMIVFIVIGIFLWATSDPSPAKPEEQYYRVTNTRTGESVIVNRQKASYLQATSGTDYLLIMPVK